MPSLSASARPAAKHKAKKTKAKGKKKQAKKKKKKKKTKRKKAPAKGKKKSNKQGSQVSYTLKAKPTTVVIAPGGEGCSTLTVEAFTKVPAGAGPGNTRTVPFQSGPSTHLVEFTTTFGSIAPNPVPLNKATGVAVATLCSMQPGVATVTARIDGLQSKQLAKQFKQCQQTKHQGCKRSGKPAPPVSVSVTFQNMYTCVGPQTTMFDDSNIEAVKNGGSPPTFSTPARTYCLTSITTYHWNEEAGATPGQLGLTTVSSRLQPKGTRLGPWHAQGSSGQNGAPNVNWYVYPPRDPPVVIEGTYSCYDSDPATWSWNKASGGLGFCTIQVIPAVRAQT